MAWSPHRLFQNFIGSSLKPCTVARTPAENCALSAHLLCALAMLYEPYMECIFTPKTNAAHTFCCSNDSLVFLPNHCVGMRYLITSNHNVQVMTLLTFITLWVYVLMSVRGVLILSSMCDSYWRHRITRSYLQPLMHQHEVLTSALPEHHY